MANIRVSELDFDQIKTNLKNYLQSQSEFTDYDFDGSGLSVLIDILAYNTHYNAYLANMLANEMFIDSAVKRSSVVSLAKHLGYTPRSTAGSVATLDITVTDPTGLPTTLTLDRFSPFTSTINGTAFTFLTIEPATIQPVNGIYTFSNIKVKQGTLLDYSYTVVDPGPDEKYEIPNTGVDTSTLFVTVQNSAIDTTLATYTLVTDITGVSGSSTVFFLEENALGNYQIYFGDGIIGRKLVAGNIVRIQYLVSVGEDANVSGSITQTFTSGGSIGGATNVAITTVSNSSGGASKESISSIKFNAPKFDQSKNRAVTKNDYAVLIKSQYPTVESISVWGGEENTPPAYGKVFISLKPFSGLTVDPVVQETIKNTILKDRKVVAITPEFVDPDYLFVNLEINARYNRNLTSQSTSQISNLIRNEIVSYFNTNLQQFELPFYYSQFIGRLSSVSQAIVSVLAELRIQKRILPILNVSNSYVEENSLKFNNRLHPGGITSTRFFIVRDGQTTLVNIRDLPDDSPPNYNGTGTLKIYNVSNDVDLGSIGTVNYATGEVEITGLIPVGYPANQFEIALTCQVQENSYDLAADKNQIIIYDESTENTAAGRLPGITVNITAI